MEKIDYEKLYKESLERAKKLHKEAIILQLEQDIKDYEFIFPELAESEDEKIRREIIYHIQHCDDTIDEVAEKRMIAWLEKQGEQKPNNNQFTPEQADILDKYIDNFLGQKSAWSEEDECHMRECIEAIATKDGWSFEEKREAKHWLQSIKQRIEE